MALLLRLFGQLVLATAVLTLTAAIVAAVYAAGRRNTRLLRSAALVASGAIVAHGILIAAGPLLTRERVLPAGSELSFCGFDCHLHVAASAGSLPGAVLLRFRSDARAVPEHPGELRVFGYDASGRAYDPVAAIPDTPLPAGDTMEQQVRFALPDSVRIDRVALVRRDWESYLVPGPENPLVQRRRSIALRDSPPAVEHGS